jgi:glycosyltransferase involved in cell wall biosynthesis
MKPRVVVLIPALNEEESIQRVIREIPHDFVSDIIVINNGSSDSTEYKAKESGALVIDEPKQGYGRACLAGIKYLENNPPSIVVFLDADYSDSPSALPYLIQPIIDGKADLVLGSRLQGICESGAQPQYVILANRFFSNMINILYHLKLTDLGPFRAIRWDILQALTMVSKTYGWSSEMIVKAARKKYRVIEIPIGCRRRIGQSKISGSIRGSIKAAIYIFYIIVKFRLK